MYKRRKVQTCLLSSPYFCTSCHSLPVAGFFERLAPDFMFSHLAAATYGFRGAVSGAQNQGSVPDPTQLLILTPAGITNNDTDDLNAKRDRRQPTKFQSSLMKLFIPFRSLQGRLTGWKCGVLSFATCASTVFFINFVITMWGLYYYKTNRGYLSTGDCDRIKRYNSGLHVVINIFSTILQAAVTTVCNV